MKTYRCPLCQSPLSKAKYESVLNIQKEKERAQQADLDKLHEQLHSAHQRELQFKKQLRDSRKKIKQAENRAAQKARLDERRRGERLMAGQGKTIKKLQERIKMLEKGTTPQEIGLADESKLVERLRREFPTDKIQHEGKGGDVLHFVRFENETTGIIVYECKHTPKILPDHVRQTSEAKRIREAHFAILVTTGQRKGFTGLQEESGVLIVAQAGVIPLASLCRTHLFSMAKAKLDKEQKAKIANQLLKYITSPTHKVPLEDVVQKTGEAQKLLKKEMKEHAKVWRDRWEIYQTINWDISHVEQNIHRVLQGQTPKALSRVTVEPLALPPARDV
jgi:hypothetical protein